MSGPAVAGAPEVAGIPFARTGREELAAAARERLDRGDEEGALALLLTDRDDWAGGEGPTEDDARRAIAAETLREAMEALRFGPVADYFAFRWSDPTYLSGLALLDAHAGGCQRVLELACGIGHFLRECTQRGIDATGVDVVFAKCWLAKRFVAPEATLVCADAASPLPDGPFDLAFCHDALHYLPDPAGVVGRLLDAAPRVVVGHAHNALVENLSPGNPLDPAGYLALASAAPAVRLYDDEELADAALRDARAPERDPEHLAGAEAVALVAGTSAPVEAGRSFTVPREGAALRRNPLVGDDGAVRWPSDRYAAEYGPRSGHLAGRRDVPATARMGPPATDVEDAARARWLLDLPERW